MAYSNDKKWYAQKLIIQERGFDIFDFLDKQIKDETWNTDFGSEPTAEELKTAWENKESADTKKINDKASGKQKLKDLGLDDDEIKALIGV
mgnify:CR=1 FL=1